MLNCTTFSIASRASPVGKLVDTSVKKIEVATSDQPIARALRTPTFRQREVRPKKGLGSNLRVRVGKQRN